MSTNRIQGFLTFVQENYPIIYDSVSKAVEEYQNQVNSENNVALMNKIKQTVSTEEDILELYNNSEE